MHSFNHDGLEIARVRHERRWLPVWHIVFFIYLGLVIRLVTMTEIGPAGYAQRMAQLENGTLVERMTAQVMQMDPVSRKIAIQVRSSLRSMGAL